MIRCQHRQDSGRRELVAGRHGNRSAHRQEQLTTSGMRRREAALVEAHLGGNRRRTWDNALQAESPRGLGGLAASADAKETL